MLPQSYAFAEKLSLVSSVLIEAQAPGAGCGARRRPLCGTDCRSCKLALAEGRNPQAIGNDEELAYPRDLLLRESGIHRRFCV